MSDSHTAKKPKTAPTGTPLVSDIDLSKVIIDKTLQGTNETRFAPLKYDDDRLVYQMTDPKEPMRAPFGVDDGSKNGYKPSMRLELSDPQLAFLRCIEDKVISTAIKNKTEWFPGVKPLPSEADIRKSFSSRISTDPEGKYQAGLRVDVTLTDDKKNLKVYTTRRLPNGKIEPPKFGSVDDVQWNDHVVPVLRTKGGVWVKKTKKMGDNLFGLIFEASEILVVKGAEDSGSGSFNLGGVEVASDDEGANVAGDAAFGSDDQVAN